MKVRPELPSSVRLIRRLILALVATLAVSMATVAAGRPPSVPLDEDFVLPIRQSVLVNGADIVITFMSVSADSRCPIDTTCVWAGDATVELGISNHVENAVISLHTTIEPRHAEINGFVIQLVTLSPAPRLDIRIEESEYWVTLRVSRVAGK